MSNNNSGGTFKLFDSVAGVPANDLVQMVHNGQLAPGGPLSGLINILGTLLAGFSASAGTVTASDSILTAFNKIVGNITNLGSPLVFTGTWNANTNTPTLTSGTGAAGHCYKVTTAGSTTLDGISQWNVGDIAVFSTVTNTWWKIDGISLEVTSVAGQTGAVTQDQITGLSSTGIIKRTGANTLATAVGDTDYQNPITLTTTGTSGAATFSGDTLNIPQYTAPVTSVAGRTGAVTLTDNDISGRTNGSAAASGIIGQVLSATVLSGAAIPVTTATVTNVTSLLLPAGDWDVEANVFITDSAVSLTSSAGGLVTVAGTFPDSSANAQLNTTGNSSSMANAWGSPVPKLVVNSNGSTTVYLQTYCTFSTGTVTACGQIQARRF